MSTPRSMIDWSDAFRIGLPEIDSQHRELIETMNALWHSIVRKETPDKQWTLIDALERYTVAHFGAEETLMRITGYNQIEAHKDAHRRFVGIIQQKKQEVGSGMPLSLDLLHFLRDWLVDHILKADRHYAVFYAASQKPRSLLGRLFGRLLG